MCLPCPGSGSTGSLSRGQRILRAAIPMKSRSYPRSPADDVDDGRHRSGPSPNCGPTSLCDREAGNNGEGTFRVDRRRGGCGAGRGCRCRPRAAGIRQFGGRRIRRSRCRCRRSGTSTRAVARLRVQCRRETNGTAARSFGRVGTGHDRCRSPAGGRHGRSGRSDQRVRRGVRSRGGDDSLRSTPRATSAVVRRTSRSATLPSGPARW